MAFAVLGFTLVGAAVGAVGRLLPRARSPLPAAFGLGLGVLGAVVGGLVGRAIVGSARGYLAYLIAAGVATLMVALPRRDPPPSV